MPVSGYFEAEKQSLQLTQVCKYKQLPESSIRESIFLGMNSGAYSTK